MTRRLRSSHPNSRAITEILEVLRRAFPERPKTWYEILHERVAFFARYIGLPGLLIASVVPTYGLFKAGIESRNVKYIQDTYATATQDLLNAGEVERAKMLLSDIKEAALRPAEHQYVYARLLAREALGQGKNQLVARDRITLLLKLHEGRPWFFPALGAEGEMRDLRLSLVDIDIKLQRYESADARIADLLSHAKGLHDEHLEARVRLRTAEIDVLRFNLNDAVANLTEIGPVLLKHSDFGSAAEADFQLAKALQFQGKHDAALPLYKKTLAHFQKVSDRQGQLRCYNNIGMLYTSRQDYPSARQYYELQQALARDILDNTALARSLVNLSLIARHEGKLPEALRLAEEALGAFQRDGGRLGIAAAHQNLAIINYRAGSRPQAILHGRSALKLFQELRDLRGVGSVLGQMGDFLRDSGDELAAGYYMAFVALQRSIAEAPTAEVAQDIKVRINDILVIRTQFGEERYALLIPRWRLLVEQVLAPQGIENPMSRLPSEVLPKSSFN